MSVLRPHPSASKGAEGLSNSTASPQQVDDGRSIGDIIRESKNLSADQVEQILAYQREHGVRFGEAAVALGFADGSDVLWALSQQFHYPYASNGASTLSSELVVASQPFSAKAEAFRAIRSQLIMRMFRSDAPRRAIAVVSPDAQDGRTFFAANLGATLSQLGGRTLLIDANLRTPRLHKLLGVSESDQGLSRILSGLSTNSAICPVQELPSLFLLPVGTVPPNPLELIEGGAFDLLIREVIGKFTYVVVDTPAATYGTDSAVIAAKCGAAIALARKDKTRTDTLDALLATLQIANVAQAGVVINEF